MLPIKLVAEKSSLHHESVALLICIIRSLGIPYLLGVPFECSLLLWLSPAPELLPLIEGPRHLQRPKPTHQRQPFQHIKTCFFKQEPIIKLSNLDGLEVETGLTPLALGAIGSERQRATLKRRARSPASASGGRAQVDLERA